MFRASRGLNQGDPLFPFLPITVMDALSHSICLGAFFWIHPWAKMTEAPLISTTYYLLTTLSFSSLTRHKEEVIDSLLNLITFFKRASGNINRNKLKFLGIVCEEDLVEYIAKKHECKVAVWPDAYLGLPFMLNPLSSLLAIDFGQN